MKANEIITERISLAKYQPALEQALRSVVEDSIGDIKSLHFKLKRMAPVVNDQDKMSLSVIRNEIVEEIKHSLIFHTKENIQKFSTTLIDTDAYIPVDVSYLRNAAGQSGGVSIEIDEKWYDSVALSLFHTLSEFVYNSLDDNNLYDAFFRILFDRNVIDDVIDSVTKEIRTLSNTILHEFVHAMQHYEVLKKHGVHYTHGSYKSYLSDPKKRDPSGKDDEFMNLVRQRQATTDNKLSGDAEQRYSTLYYASPQEMDAFAHNVAQKTLYAISLGGTFSRNDDFIIDADSYARGEYNESIESCIRGYVSEYITPSSPEAAKIFKRYVKLSYQATIDAIDSLLYKTRPKTPDYKERLKAHVNARKQIQ